MENQQLVFPSRQCSSTSVGFGQRFLGDEQCDNTAASTILFSSGSGIFLPVQSIEISNKGKALL
jgi:hypothetical protein